MTISMGSNKKERERARESEGQFVFVIKNIYNSQDVMEYSLLLYCSRFLINAVIRFYMKNKNIKV